jgi:hypothetical protein
MSFLPSSKKIALLTTSKIRTFGTHNSKNKPASTNGISRVQPSFHLTRISTTCNGISENNTWRTNEHPALPSSKLLHVLPHRVAGAIEQGGEEIIRPGIIQAFILGIETSSENGDLFPRNGEMFPRVFKVFWEAA